MEFKDGAGVFAADGDQIGTIDRVVLNPQTKVVTDIVVRKGTLLTEDKVIPIQFIKSAVEDRITLRKAAADLQNLPPFEESDFISLYGDGVDYVTGTIQPIYPYPPLGTALWNVLSVPSTTEVVRNIPGDTVALKEGAEVKSADDKQVGHIERIFADPGNKRVTHFLVTHGLLLKKRKLIPTGWVTTVKDREVQLGVESTVIERVPVYQEEV